ncbi:hypothetical protein TWF217_002580 [Orbilia oligospora]|nr:hypothetical protein TWF217_002580 [Orbilia oligospora]
MSAVTIPMSFFHSDLNPILYVIQVRNLGDKSVKQLPRSGDPMMMVMILQCNPAMGYIVPYVGASSDKVHCKHYRCLAIISNINNTYPVFPSSWL